MFGGDMMKKLQEMQQVVEESKRKLNDLKVEENINGKILVKANGNRIIENIEILDHKNMEKEELEDILLLALNRVIEKASALHDVEMANSTRGMIPGM